MALDRFINTHIVLPLVVKPAKLNSDSDMNRIEIRVRTAQMLMQIHENKAKNETDSVYDTMWRMAEGLLEEAIEIWKATDETEGDPTLSR